MPQVMQPRAPARACRTQADAAGQCVEGAVQARLIRMSYFEARSHQDIATELGLPLGTVKSHLRRAFQRLQGELGNAP